MEDKSNKIPAVQQLIDLLDLAGAVVMADAIHCQKETAEKIIAQKADYVLMGKENQESLQAEVQQAILRAFEEENLDTEADVSGCPVKEKQPLASAANGCHEERRRRVELPTSSLGS